MCEHLTVNDIRVRNPWYAQNGDGIDVESCRYISITNSSFDVGDDAICVKSGKDKEGRIRGIPTKYMKVDNCIVYHGHGGFTVGSEMSGGVSDVWVSNCTFTGTDVGLRFKSARGRGGVVEDIHIENIRMINIAGNAIIFNLFYAGMAPTENGEDPIRSLVKNAPGITEDTPEFRNISITGISCQGATGALQIMGLPEMPVKGLILKNSVFTCERGIHCLFAAELTLDNVQIYSSAPPAINLVNVIGANIVSCAGSSEKLLLVDGSESADISVIAENEADFKQRTELGHGAPVDAVSFGSPD